jgi:hypothetical protein
MSAHFSFIIDRIKRKQNVRCSGAQWREKNPVAMSHYYANGESNSFVAAFVS